MCCISRFMTGGGERLGGEPSAPRAVILFFQPRHSGAIVCAGFVFVLTVLWSVSARWRLRGCGQWLCRCLRASWRRRLWRSGLGSPAPASCGRRPPGRGVRRRRRPQSCRRRGWGRGVVYSVSTYFRPSLVLKPASPRSFTTISVSIVLSVYFPSTFA